MIDTFLTLCPAVLFGVLAVAFGYCTLADKLYAPPMYATVLLALASGGLALMAIRELLK